MICAWHVCAGAVLESFFAEIRVRSDQTMTMNIIGNLTQAMQTHAQERLSAAVDQFHSHVKRLVLVLTDNNGPRGGVDQVARVSVSLSRGAPVVIEHRGEDAYAVISHLADKVKNTISRRVDKLTRKRK
jgi:ribosome-associated translation inhibitor RaiA